MVSKELPGMAVRLPVPAKDWTGHIQVRINVRYPGRFPALLKAQTWVVAINSEQQASIQHGIFFLP
jgi:hypothetical protein